MAPPNGTCNATFSWWDSDSGGVQVGAAVLSPTLQVQSGLFTIALDFGWNFNGEGRSLQTAVGCGEAQATLAPRTALTPAPYAFALPGMRTVPGYIDGSFLPTMNVIGGIVSSVKENTVSGSSFDSAIVGGINNIIVANSRMSQIGGGRSNLIRNTSSFSAIGGGDQNRIETYSAGGTIGGGLGNVLENGANNATISGGASNRIQDFSVDSVVAGGFLNRIAGISEFGAIGGGKGNVITNSASFATIPGGYQAQAALYGQQAYASGAFGNSGDAQVGLYVLRGVTTTLYLDGSGAKIKIPVSRNLTMRILIAARSTTNNATGAYQTALLAERSNATIYVNGSSLSGYQAVPAIFEDNSAWGCFVRPDQADGAFELACVGDSLNTVRFVATIRTAELQADPVTLFAACQGAGNKKSDCGDPSPALPRSP